MAHTFRTIAIVSGIILATEHFAFAQSATSAQAREAALQRLQAATGGEVIVSDHKATGGARFIRVPSGRGRSLGAGPAIGATQKEQQSRLFFAQYGSLIGVPDAQSMRLAATNTDSLGETHLTFNQFYGSVPVYAATIRTHFDAGQQLKAVTGTAIPDISLNPTPSIARERAAQIARAEVVADRGDSDALRTGPIAEWMGPSGESR